MKENGNKRLRILSIILVVVLHIALITCVSPGGSTYGLSWALSVAYTLSLFFTAFVFGKSWAFLVLATAYWGLLLVSFWLAFYVPVVYLLFPVYYALAPFLAMLIWWIHTVVPASFPLSITLFILLIYALSCISYWAGNTVMNRLEKRGAPAAEN